MNIQGSYTFYAPRELVWQHLLDSAVLADAIPGCVRLEQTSDTYYHGEVDWQKGPLASLFSGTITLEKIQPHESFQMHVGGIGSQGPVRGTGRVWFVETGEEADIATTVHYEGIVSSMSPVAERNPRLIVSTTQSFLRQALSGIDHQLQEETRLHAPLSQHAAISAETAPHLLDLDDRPTRNTIAASDVLAEIRRDRRIWVFLGVLMLLLLFTTVGGMVVAWHAYRWFIGHVARQAAEHPNYPASPPK